MAFAKYRPVDTAMWRVSAFGALPAAPWPDRDGSAEQWCTWISQVWAFTGVAEAITQASPGFAEQVTSVVNGTSGEERRLTRIGHSLARYVVRMRGRATPFGLFAGVAPLRFGPTTSVGSDSDAQLRMRANGEWVAALIAGFESRPALVRRLQVIANDLVIVRGQRLYVQWQPHSGDPAPSRPLDVSLRFTDPVAFVLKTAEHSILVADLAGKAQVKFPAAPAALVESLLGQLVAAGALITELRPPSTAVDALGHMLGVLDAVDLSEEPAVRGLLAQLHMVHARIESGTACDGASRAKLAAQMRALTAGLDRPLGVDLRAGGNPRVSRRVAAEAATAVDTLLALSWAPAGLPGWREYHARFLQRYGAGTLVPVNELVDPAAGLGYPRHYTASSPSSTVQWSRRDQRLLQLAQQAALDGVTEVQLTRADLAALADVSDGERYGPAHLDATVEVRATSAGAVDRGEFTLMVNGFGRSLTALSGRFLDLIPGHESGLVTGVPTVVEAAVVAQLSFPPHRPAAETVTRVRQVLPTVISIAEHRHARGTVIRLPDLAVTADLDRMYVVTLSSRQVIEPVVTSAAAPHTMPPVVRLLSEIPRATGAAVSLFDWGAGRHLPFKPRLRYGRTILAPACWQVPTGALPGPAAPQQLWHAAFNRLRERLRLPGCVAVGDGEQQLRLMLDEPMDEALLRAHMDRADGPVTLAEAPGEDELGWCAGRAHEIVVPLARIGPSAEPTILRRIGHRPVVSREHGHLPGGPMLFAKLYGPMEAFSTIISEHLPQLHDHDNPSRWWFVRYRDPYPHLRLRQLTDDFGRDAARLGQWAAHLRRLRLAGDLVLDTYQPETSRYGTGPVMQAAEDLFVADSVAATAQLTACHGQPDVADAVTAVSHLDLLTGLLGTRDEAIGWLLHRAGLLPRTTAHSRQARHQAITLARVSGTDPGETSPLHTLPGGAEIAAAWAQRRTAARAYAQRLADDPAAPAASEVATSLLHMHHNRAAGIDPGSEARIYHLARSVALAATARSTASAEQRS